MKTIIYDIETIPDLDFGRKHMNLNGLSDEDIGRSMFFQQLQKHGNEFLPIDLQKIIIISFVTEHNGHIELSSCTDVATFLDSIKDADHFVTWNGNRFDVPVLYFRAVLNNLAFNEKIFDKNHHTDLKALLSNGDVNSISGLDWVSKHLGLPGKSEHTGNAVWDLYLEKKIDEVVRYCESDALNTYLIYVQHQLSMGVINEQELNTKKDTLKKFLASQDNPHSEFIQQL